MDRFNDNDKFEDMKAKTGFNLRKVCGQNIIVAEGKENMDFSNIISMNESSALLWQETQGKDFTEEDLVTILQANYQLDENTPLPYDQALKDVREVIEQWHAAGIIND